VAIAAVAAGVILGKTETASQTASPLSASNPSVGASLSRIAARRTSGRIPSSTRSSTGLGPIAVSLVGMSLASRKARRLYSKCSTKSLYL
jgi:hypothetical protein